MCHRISVVKIAIISVVPLFKRNPKGHTWSFHYINTLPWVWSMPDVMYHTTLAIWGF